MSRDFRILVLGDTYVGKSSLVNTFLKDVPYVPEASTSTSRRATDRCLPVVSVPALNGGTLYIVDSPAPSASKGNNIQLTSWHESQIDRADAVVIACSLEDSDELHRKIQQWSDTVVGYADSSKRRKSRYLPMVLAATKSDLLKRTGDFINEEDIKAKHPQLEAVVACSCTNNVNVAEGGFWYAQQAIESPLYPLYDATAQKLRPSAEQAFSRIYALIARESKTIYPSDLQELQYRVFRQHITASEVDKLILQTTGKGRAQDGDGLPETAFTLTQQDFQAFICAFLERRRAEPVWRILRCYGYSTRLQLERSFTQPKIVLSSDGNDCVELSAAGIAFVSQLWLAFQETAPGAILLDQYLDSVGVNAALAERFTKCTILEDFVCQWRALAVSEPSRLLESLALLGFSQSAQIQDIEATQRDQQDYINVAESVKVLRRHSGNRRVFTALVLGDAASITAFQAVAKDITALGEGTYLVLLHVADITKLSATRLGQADLAIYVYSHRTDENTPTSVEHLASIRETAPQKLLNIPSITAGIMLEVDERDSPSDPAYTLTATQEATDFCAAAGLSAPIVLSSVDQLRQVASQRLSARQRSGDGTSGSTNWLLWSSALIASMAAGLVLLQRSGWLQSTQRYWNDRS